MRPIVILAFIACMAPAQQDTAPPTFEVASVKVAAPSPGPGAGTGPMRTRGCMKPDPAMVRCTNATLKMLLMRAYGVKNYQIQGPAWIESDGYDLMAKVPDGVPADKVPAMLQALLAERFGAKIHKETRILPAYELTVAKGGPKLREAETGKLPAMPEPGSGSGPPPLSSLPAGAVMFMINANGSRMVRGNMTIEQLVNHLTTSLDRPVFDKTDLKGTYEIDLSYLGNESDGIGKMFAANGPPPGPDPGGRGDPGRQADANTPIATVFQAVQETLGLKLEAKKSPVETIVVDSANKVPTEN